MDSSTKTRLTLEMRSPAQLVRARPNSNVRLREVEENDAQLKRIFHEVGDPHLWSAQNWVRYGSAPAKRHWLIDVDEEAAGLLTLLAGTDGGVEIVSFGLVSSQQGRGLGGAALTKAIELAWTAFGEQVSRVWLHTNNFDHPRALPNYLKRGFVVTEKVVLPVNVPGGRLPHSSW